MPALPSLTDRRPQVSPERLLRELVPPRHFARASFEGYHPDPAHPSQRAARDRLQQVATELRDPPRRGLLRRRPAPPAVYLDGGFGVGKTHLLAALSHAVTGGAGERTGDGPAVAYGTFVEITQLVGAIGFAATVDALRSRRLVCIDEFELDDPGDTLIMSRLLRELADAGVALAATSNTLPDQLGEGRFAAEDFLREIQGLASRFEVVRIDGPDYRHRTSTGPLPLVPTDEVGAAVARTPGATCDGLGEVLAHLRTVHPSRYGALVEDLTLIGWTGVTTLDDQADALRVVALVDRLYEADVPLLLAGDGAALFSDEMLAGGYRKKYLRASSRLGALARAGVEVAAGRPGGLHEA